MKSTSLKNGASEKIDSLISDRLLTMYDRNCKAHRTDTKCSIAQPTHCHIVKFTMQKTRVNVWQNVWAQFNVTKYVLSVKMYNVHFTVYSIIVSVFLFSLKFAQRSNLMSTAPQIGFYSVFRFKPRSSVRGFSVSVLLSTSLRIHHPSYLSSLVLLRNSKMIRATGEWTFPESSVKHTLSQQLKTVVSRQGVIYGHHGGHIYGRRERNILRLILTLYARRLNTLTEATGNWTGL